jgi:putative PIG3 family NAD(P)H quinone oxidoreductase
MRAIEIAQPGGPEVLRLVNAPMPLLRADEVLVQVEFAGVNRADTAQRAGRYPPPTGASAYPGLECSGEVVELGELVETVRVGQKVCALLSGGGYAEYVAVPAAHVLPIPHGIDMAGAASLPEVACTVYSNLKDIVHGDAAASVLIHGGASGIGTFAIQWLAAESVTVYCTVGSEEKATRCRSLGAAQAFHYREDDFVAKIAAETGGVGVNAILDIVGAPYVEGNLACLALDGVLVLIGTQGGAEPLINLKTVIRKRLTLRGSSLRGRSEIDKAGIVAGVEKDIWPRVAAGLIRPVIHSVLPLADAAEAHRMLEGSQHFGKIVLAVS